VLTNIEATAFKKSLRWNALEQVRVNAMPIFALTLSVKFFDIGCRRAFDLER